MKKSSIALGLVLAGLLMMVLGATSAGATKPPDHKITICHATDSYSNPYVVITVDVASTRFAGHEGHLGPIFYPTIPKHTKWGDIIPPTSNDGTRQVTPRNWPAGAAILANGCKLPSSSTTTSTSTTQPCDCTTTSTTTVDSTTTSTTGPTTTTTEGPTTSTTEGPPRHLPRPPTTESSTTAAITPPTTGGSLTPPGQLAHTGSTSVLLFTVGLLLMSLGVFLVRRFGAFTRG